MIFENFEKNLKRLNFFRENLGQPISYGISFLDDALGGIYPDDLILITAKTGGGKTELATNIAANAASHGKTVHFFALEAHPCEIESRIKFKMLATCFYMQMYWRDIGKFPDYQLWFQGKQDDILKKFEPEVDEILSQQLKTMHTYYTDKEFNINSFEHEMGIIGDKTDLIILDHLHFFDFDDVDENQALKRTIKQIKNVVTQYRKPAIIVVQLRKAERYSEQILPETDDIHGSSDVSKIASKIIVSGPAREEVKKDKNMFPTFFRILKNRTSGARTFYTALCNFDSTRNGYEKEYVLGNVINNGTEFQQLEGDYPQWATR